MIDAAAVMAYRQLKRFLRASSRVIGMIVNPLIWLVFFGLGWANVFNFPMATAIFGGVDYLTYLAPGVVSMAIFTASFVAGISVLWDKQFGFLKEVLVAPASRTAAILGRAMGDSVTAVAQGMVILAMTFLLAEELNPQGVLPAVGVGFLLAMSFTSLGITIAMKMRSMEGFQMLMSFIMMPLLFMSGAFYPISAMPDWMKALSRLNPLTYAVDAMRYFLTGTSAMDPAIDIALLAALTAVLIGISAATFRKATIE